MALPLLPLLLLGGFAALALSSGSKSSQKALPSPDPSPDKKEGPCEFVVANGTVTPNPDGTCKIVCQSGYYLKQDGRTCAPEPYDPPPIGSCTFLVKNGRAYENPDGTCRIECNEGYKVDGWTCVEIAPEPQPQPQPQPQPDPDPDPVLERPVWEDCITLLKEVYGATSKGPVAVCSATGREFSQTTFGSPELAANVANAILYCRGKDPSVTVEDVLSSDAYGSSRFFAASSNFEPGSKPQSIAALQAALAAEVAKDGGAMYQGKVDGIWGNCTMSALYEGMRKVAVPSIAPSLPPRPAFEVTEDEPPDEPSHELYIQAVQQAIDSGQIPEYKEIVIPKKMPADIGTFNVMFPAPNLNLNASDVNISFVKVSVQNLTTDEIETIGFMPAYEFNASNAYIESRPTKDINALGVIAQIELGRNAYNNMQYIKTSLMSGTNTSIADGAYIVTDVAFADTPAKAAAGNIEDLRYFRYVQPLEYQQSSS